MQLCGQKIICIYKDNIYIRDNLYIRNNIQIKDNVSIKDKNLHSNAITDKYYHKCGKLDIGNRIKVNYYRKRMVSMY